MLGVERFVFPLTLRSPHPWSSLKMMTMFGFRSALGASVLGTEQDSRLASVAATVAAAGVNLFMTLRF